MMRPYKGKRFNAEGFPSLLLIGESHFLDDDSPQRSDPGAWYSGSSATLTDYEISFISTSKLLENATADGFPLPTHSIYSNPFWEINQFGPLYDDYRAISDHVAFYNFFQRPAVDGNSLESELSERDIETANEVFLQNYNELAPTAVIFLSRLAHEYFRQSISVPVFATPHPGSAWWNRTATNYGNKRGRDILGDFIKTTTWASNVVE